MQLSALWDSAKLFAQMDIPQAEFLIAASTAAEEYERADSRLIAVLSATVAANGTRTVELPAGFSRRNLTQVTLTSADGSSTREVRQVAAFTAIANEPGSDGPLFYEFASDTFINLNFLFGAGTLRFERATTSFTDMDDDTAYPLLFGVLTIFGETMWSDERAAGWRKQWEAQITRDIDTVDMRSARMDSGIFGEPRWL